MANWDHLVAGDEIGVWVSSQRTELETVERTTATRIILENGRVFNRHGVELKSAVTSYPTGRLALADGVRNYLAHREQQRSTADAVRSLIALLGGRKNGLGDYRLEPNELALVQQLLATMQAPKAETQG